MTWRKGGQYSSGRNGNRTPGLCTQVGLYSDTVPLRLVELIFYNRTLAVGPE